MRLLRRAGRVGRLLAPVQLCLLYRPARSALCQLRFVPTTLAYRRRITRLVSPSRLPSTQSTRAPLPDQRRPPRFLVRSFNEPIPSPVAARAVGTTLAKRIGKYFGFYAFHSKDAPKCDRKIHKSDSFVQWFILLPLISIRSECSLVHNDVIFLVFPSPLLGRNSIILNECKPRKFVYHRVFFLRSVAYGTWQVGSARQLFSQSQNDFVGDEEGGGPVSPAAKVTEALRQRYKFRMYGPSVSFDGNRNHTVRPQPVVGGYHTIAGPSRHHRQPRDSTATNDSGTYWRYSSQDSGFSGRSDVRDVAGSQCTLANSDCEGDCFSADDYKRFHSPPGGLDLDLDAPGQYMYEMPLTEKN